MMVKLKNIRDDKESGEFEFKVFLTKRPEVYPNWDDPESDEEEVQSAPPYGVARSMGMQRRLLPDESAMLGWGPAPNQTQSSL